MLIYLIIIGLFQATLLPGWIVSYGIKSLSIIDRFVIASGLSLVVNYFIVGFLYLTGAYSQKSLLVIIAVEVLFIYFLRKNIYNDVKTLIANMQQYMKKKIQTKSICFFEASFILFLLTFLYLFRKNGFLTVFTHWDAVVSWNRWAVEFYSDSFQNSLGYPQAIPMLLSLVYTLANETNVQTFTKLICVFWPLLGGMSIFATARHAPKYKNVLAISAFVYLYLLSNGSWDSTFIFSGLVDPIMAAYGALFIYGCSLISKIDKLNSSELRILYLSSLMIAGSSLVKLTGVIITVMFLTYVAWVLFKNKLLKINASKFILLFTLIFLISIHWYVLHAMLLNTWQIDDYNTLQDSRLWIRPIVFTKLFINTVGWPFVAMCLTACVVSLPCRVVMILLIAPIFLFCSVAVGYDLRAIFVIFEPLAVVCSVGILYWLRIVCKILISGDIEIALTSNLKYKVNLILLAFVVGIGSVFMALPIYFTAIKILELNTEKRVVANDFDGGNRYILSLLSKEPSFKIISCWQLPFGLPGAQNRYIPTGDCGIKTIKRWLSDENIKYFLYWDPHNLPNLPSLSVVREIIIANGVEFNEEIISDGYVMFSKKIGN